MDNTEKVYYTEKTLIPGKIYMKEIYKTPPHVKQAMIEKTLLGEYISFHVDHRNGCSIYDEPYLIFMKDGKTYHESTLDLQWWKAKVYEVSSDEKVETPGTA